MTKLKKRIEQARAAGVSTRTLQTWRKRPDWVEDASGAVDRTWMQKYARSRLKEAARAQRGPFADEKRRLLEARIRRLQGQSKIDAEVLRREKLRTGEQEGRLIDVSKSQAYWTRKASEMRAIVESWRLHNSAKSPRLVTEIDGLADSFIDAIRSVFDD